MQVQLLPCAPLSCWPVAQLAEHSAVTGDAAGSSPAWPAITERTHSSAGERRFYKAEALGSIPSACTTHATLAQLDQSAGLRSRRSKVQLLHVAPHTSSVNHAALAQRIRAPGFDPGGRGFKSCTPHQLRRTRFAIAAVLRWVPMEALVSLRESRWSVTTRRFDEIVWNDFGQR